MKQELLSPAGDLECLKTAIRFGADAVYLGGSQLQLRAQTVGFGLTELSQALGYAHDRGKRIYVALNAFANNDETHGAGDYARALYDLGVDAVIVSDLGVLAAVKGAAPGLEVHISTQANCQNYMAARTYYDLGAKRIVLAREMSVEEIAVLRAKTPPGLELEAFVHGAMCMAYSGRCLISSYLANRSGNRGNCAQPCRWSYHLVEEKRQGEFFPIEETEDGTAILSSHDLCCLSFLDQLAQAGVWAFKIEGRMKTPYYVATVTNAYRRRMDETAPLSVLLAELDAVSHRPYSSGFYLGQMPAAHFNDGGYRQSCLFAGTVKGAREGAIVVEQRNRFHVGDKLELLSPRFLARSFLVETMADAEGEPRQAAHLPGEHVTINCPYPAEPGDLLRLRTG